MTPELKNWFNNCEHEIRIIHSNLKKSEQYTCVAICNKTKNFFKVCNNDLNVALNDLRNMLNGDYR